MRAGHGGWAVRDEPLFIHREHKQNQISKRREGNGGEIRRFSIFSKSPPSLDHGG